MATYQYPGARRGSGAFLLVILLALAIVLYLMFGTGGTGTSYMKQVSSARVNAKKTVQEINTQQLSILIGQYRQEHGSLPKTAADMEAEAYFKDPWGGPITFTFETAKGGAGAGGATRVHYHSNGPDLEPKTEDDQDKTDTLPL
jgi:hypothetical protein